MIFFYLTINWSTIYSILEMHMTTLRKYMKIRTALLVSSLPLCFFVSANAKTFENEGNKTQMFSLHLGATRVIYNIFSSGETLTIINDYDYPMLVQSEVLLEDQKTPAPFIITPPLFRLDALQSSRLRIVRTGGDFPKDRETLQWICVKGIPPKSDEKWAESNKNSLNNVTLNVQVSLSTCIKMFVRPSSVKGHPEDVAGEVKWQRVNNKLKGVNPTPFYINLSELRVGGEEISEHHYIAPFSSFEYPIPVSKSSKVQWKIVTDYGGVSEFFETDINL